MSLRLWGVGTLPKLNDPKIRVVTITTLLTTLSFSLFFITELIAVAAAIVWAISDILHLPLVVTAAIALMVGWPTVWAAAAVAILVFNAATDPENNRP